MGELATSDDILDEIAVTQIANARHDIATAASSLKDNIHLQAIANEKGFCDVNEVTNANGRALDNHLSNMERDIQNRIFETQKEALEAKCAVLTKVGDESKWLAKEICDVKEDGAKNTQKILDEIAKSKYDALKDELDELRAERYNDKAGYNFALAQSEINSLKSMVNSIEQTQRQSNKTSVFGSGNAVIPSNIANQG